ncbi:MAG TPA: accessory factor UbiK family protein [Magnetospirillaceae bacterium]
MQTENKLFDDFARLAGGAFNAFGALKSELEAQMRQHMETLLAKMKLVTREEFDAMQAMLTKAREEQAALAARVAALELDASSSNESGDQRHNFRPSEPSES